MNELERYGYEILNESPLEVRYEINSIDVSTEELIIETDMTIEDIAYYLSESGWVNRREYENEVRRLTGQDDATVLLDFTPAAKDQLKEIEYKVQTSNLTIDHLRASDTLRDWFTSEEWETCDSCEFIRPSWFDKLSTDDIAHWIRTHPNHTLTQILQKEIPEIDIDNIWDDIYDPIISAKIRELEDLVDGFMKELAGDALIYVKDRYFINLNLL